MRISDWSSDVCSSDLMTGFAELAVGTDQPLALREGREAEQRGLRRMALSRRALGIERRHQRDETTLRGRYVHRARTVEDRPIALAGVVEFPSGERVEERIIARPVAAGAALPIGPRIVESV